MVVSTADTEVAEATEDASVEDESTEETQSARPEPTVAEVEATWKKRVAGKDAYAAQVAKERDELRARLADFEKTASEAQRAKLSEEERLKLAVADYEQRVALAEQRARAAELKAQFPKAFDMTHGELLNPEVLASIEATLAETPPTPAPPKPEPNAAGRRAPSSVMPGSEKTSEDILAELRKFGNPFKDEE